jgi:N-acetylneuraminate synthase
LTGIYIIAEAGVNHNGSIEMAYHLIDLAADAGADAVKFQTFRAEDVISNFAPKAPYQELLTPVGESQLEMLRKLQLDELQHKELLKYCQLRNIEFISSPFDLESVDLLVHRLNVSRLKIASGEITNAPLLLKAACTGKNIILSTGMSSLGEVETALGVLAFGYSARDKRPSRAAFQASYASCAGRTALREKVTLLHCTSEYPAPLKDINLRAMDTLQQAFSLKVGYSDHSPGLVIPIAAAARGAAVIEKHFTLDRNLPGPDHKASLEPAELKEMVKLIRQVELALGSPVKAITPAEVKNRSIVRKSLVAVETIQRGETFTDKNVGIKRPGTGIPPGYYWEILGRKAERDYAPDQQVTVWNDL